MNAKKIIFISAGLALMASMALAIPTFAQTNSPNDQSGDNNHPNVGAWNGQMRGQGRMPGQGMKPGVFGTVSAINGDIITVSGRQGFGPAATAAPVVYTVDATNATVRKNNATSTVSSILVGDRIFAQGTVTGTNVAATMIFDSVMGRTGNNGSQDKNGQGDQGHATSTPPFVGNGQPVIAGTISAINGASLTLTTGSNVTYTVDASSAKILEGQSTIVLSGLTVGDKVLIQGAVNGTSVTATTIVDQHAPPSATPAHSKGQSRGFFGSIGQFFMHLFGF
ncbi:MAG: hypothetical protein ABSF56_00610 [Minisyncoccia bacterium]|jgi:hypothetical protein